MMAEKKKKKKQTPSKKQKLWVEFYLKNGFNASLAARQAGYKQRGSGYENLSKPYIEEYIQERLAEAAMGANEVLARITAMAKGFDIADYITLVATYGFNKDGEEFITGHDIVCDLDKLQEDGFSHLIKTIKSTANGIIIVWHDSLAALGLLAKHHKLITDKIDINANVLTTSTPDAVKALQEARKEMGGG